MEDWRELWEISESSKRLEKHLERSERENERMVRAVRNWLEQSDLLEETVNNWKKQRVIGDWRELWEIGNLWDIWENREIMSRVMRDRRYFPGDRLLDGWQQLISLKGAGIQNSWRSTVVATMTFSGLNPQYLFQMLL